MAVLSGFSLALAGGTLVIAAVEAPAASAGDRGALYVAISGVLVAMITGVVALLRDRKPDPPTVRYIDPPTSHSLPAEMSDLLAVESRRVDELRAEVAATRAEVDLWQQRAYQSGWRS